MSGLDKEKHGNAITEPIKVRKQALKEARNTNKVIKVRRLHDYITKLMLTKILLLDLENLKKERL